MPPTRLTDASVYGGFLVLHREAFYSVLSHAPSLRRNIEAAAQDRQAQPFPLRAIEEAVTQVQPHYERAYTYDTWMESVGIPQKFAEGLAKHDTTSLIPEEAYKNPEYRWSFRGNYAAPVAT